MNKSLFILLAMTLIALALQAQPMMGERFDNQADPVEYVGFIKQVVEFTPEAPGDNGGDSDRPNRQGPGGGMGRPGGATSTLIYVNLVSGDNVLIGTTDYWAKKDVDFKTGDAIRFTVLPTDKENTYVAATMTYKDEAYTLFEEGRPVWAPQMNHDDRGPRGNGGTPPRGGRW